MAWQACRLSANAPSPIPVTGTPPSLNLMHWPCNLLLLLPALVLGNTEIINFDAALRPTAPQLRAQPWPTLRAAPRTTTHWTLVPAPLGTPRAEVCAPAPAEPYVACAHELWLVLELTKYERFTLRLSYAASSPTDFLIDVLDPRDAASLHHLSTTDSYGGRTSTKYGRIRALDTGVRTPPYNRTETEPVEFVLVLEPLYLGMLPATVVPFLLMAAPVLALAGAVLPRVQTYIEGLVGEARSELAGKEKQE
ncbi:hypothetical protein FB451DRAFT_519483 [Mycena latifolia]|nr:hypothetical protein FB451DRAFT_519483 [Mycena latifolia]